MGYDPAQREALAQTIAQAAADVVVSGTPADIGALPGLAKRVIRARYEYEEAEAPGLGGVLDRFLARGGR